MNNNKLNGSLHKTQNKLITRVRQHGIKEFGKAATLEIESLCFLTLIQVAVFEEDTQPKSSRFAGLISLSYASFL